VDSTTPYEEVLPLVEKVMFATLEGETVVMGKKLKVPLKRLRTCVENMTLMHGKWGERAKVGLNAIIEGPQKSLSEINIL